MKTNRREFIKSMGFMSVGLASVLAMPRLAKANQNTELFSETRMLMGTYVTLKAVHNNKDIVQEAFTKAFEAIELSASILTRHDSRSALSLLNNQKAIKDAPQDLLNVALAAKEVEKNTFGAFNPSVLSVLEYLEAQKTISASEQKELYALVKQNSFSLAHNSIRLAQSDLKITFDGIAKGYIVDKAHDQLLNAGLQDFIVNAGGDMRAHGMKSDTLTSQSPWRVAIEDPYKQGNYPTTLGLKDMALATSGSYEKKFSANLNHLIIPVANNETISTERLSVSVLAPTAMQADSLATAFSCMSIEQTLSMANTLPQVECFIIAKDNSVHTSKNWG